MTIRLQNINGYLYPTDCLSNGVLEDEFGLGRIPCDKFYFYSPKIIKKGHRMAIEGDIDDIV